MIIPRDTYLQQLIDSRFNSLIKVITGIRRSGKSYLLFKIYVIVNQKVSHALA
jgi:predicted AAA+ superfamily ATPase